MKESNKKEKPFLKKQNVRKAERFWLSETAAGGGKGELVLWRRGEGKEEG